ncbi:hypothetical protein S83_013230, partial [Arachis hypogaea]
MASGSSSGSIPPPTRSWTYHVFLSFRGEDTRTGFTGHLYAALNRKGITTYKDDQNLRKGDVISKELLKAIEESMFAVIVFSPDYASSSWCLDELQKIIECKNQLGQQIEAVFYGVEPSDVRHQRGSFEKALKKHEKRHDSEKVKRWRDALTQVAAHSGWTSKNQDEAVLVENIAQHIFEILIPKLPSSMKNLVGINSKVEQVITLMGLGLNDVRFIGISGMGGMGKTTIARAVFETIRCGFEVTCFLANVRENCEKKDITDMQKQLLDQMNISSNAVYNQYDGRTIIQNSLRLKKVLLILDDVNQENQLENLAGEQAWFGPGSRIIITTRDVEALKGPEVHETYEVEGLVESEALNLFCLKAFKQQKPTEGFLDLSKEVVKYSGGLPLALEVLGSYLNGRPIAVWYSAIERIKKTSHSEIIDVLKISYEGLEDTEKDIFLDIACFFKGDEKDGVTKKLKRCGHDAEIGIDILINKSLITIDIHGCLGMHDLLEEMGKQIVIQESPNDACNRSRLWCSEDVEFVLAQKEKTKATHGIVLRKWYSEAEVIQRDLSLSKMCQLKLLILDDVKAPILCYIPCTLKIFRWRHCPLKILPLTDHQSYELVEIDLPYSEIVELWDGQKVLEKLEYLNLVGCKQLKQTPDLSMAPNLKELDLRECEELDYIHPSLAHHKRLVELNLGCCERLETLGDKLEMSSLEELYLDWCSSLRRLPDLSGAPNLKILDLRGCKELDYIHPSLAHHKRLVELNLGYCERLETLGDKLEMSSLERLDLYSCSSLRRLPEFGECMKQLSKIILAYTDIESLTVRADYDDSDGSSREESTLSYDIAHLASLTDLDLSENMFLRVPISIHQLTRLTRLQLWDCSELEVLPELPSSLRELGAGGCYSLAAWNVDEVISKACCGFAESASQDREDFLQMLITGEEIPAWFEHQEEDNGVSVSFPQNCPSIETIALALCFVIEIEEDIYPIMPSVICNGKEFINASLYPFDGSDNLFIVCVNGYYCSKLLCQHNRFQILSPDDDNIDIRVKRCGARWVFKQDMQDFKKRKATLELNMDISHSSASRNKMLVVDSPIYEEEIEPAATAEASICHLASRKSSDPPQLLPPFPLQEVHETYNVEGLMESEALNLFSLEAFNLPKPSEEFLDLSKEVVKEVVKYSGGLPLALQVLGSYLNGRPIVVWHSAIEKIKQFSHSEIIDVLKISFDGLDDMEKNIFLDIACFFKGYEKGNVTRILEGCGYQAELGLHILINRSLVTINKYDQLEMHDLLEEMGKRIVIQESPNDPSKRSRLWCYEDLNSVLAQKKGTEAIQSIVLNSSSEKHLRFEAFSKLKLSKLLILCGVEVEVEPPSDLPCLPSTLKVLHWWRCPLKTLPLAETEHEFAEIELRFSRIEELWLGKKFLGNLKYLNLSHSWYLKETPDFSGTPILETLILGDCPDLREVHPSLLLHENLVLLDLSKCISLKTFPGILYMTSLKELILKDCRSFENRPEFGECMKHESHSQDQDLTLTNTERSKHRINYPLVRKHLWQLQLQART